MKTIHALAVATVFSAGSPALAQPPSGGASSPAAPRCAPTLEQEVRRDFNRFVDLLIVDKKPKEALETYAVSDLVQHDPAFGTNRASTIAQWETMTSKPETRFAVKGFSIEGGIGLVRFRGQLAANAPGASVTVYFRFQCGKIVETWDNLDVGF